MLAQKNDSTDLYSKIKKVAYKKRFTTLLYHSIFVEPSTEESSEISEPIDKKEVIVKKTNTKIIRNINIVVYNPFGHKEEDTIHKLDNFFENVANHIHINSRHWIIINRLLFNKNDTLNILELSESERLLRGAAFINDARITTTKTKSLDSVDVTVEVYDKWPITAPSYITDKDARITFINRNLFGVGQQFEQYVRFRLPDVLDYNGSYTISNLDNTYISSQLYYTSSIVGTNVGLSFDRPYFSPIVAWAGGINISHNWGFYNYTDSLEGVTKKMTLNSFYQDVWLGKSFKLKKNKTLFNQSTNIITGLRYYTNAYLARPMFNIDASSSNVNTSSIVGNIGFSVQQYYKDKFIYRFGSTEDIPEGLIIQTTYGVSKKEFNPIRYYIGAEIARAKKFSFGYLTSTISYGLFFNKFINNNITTKFSLYCLGNLIKIGRWNFRQFVNYDIIHGQNKLPTETITLTSDELYGFNNSTLSGNTKMTLKAESVTYAPYEFIGFKFASVITIGLGIIGTQQNRISNSLLYQAYSFGILLRNEHLVSSTFQFSIGMYPVLPSGKNNVFLFNPITSFTLRVRSFSMGRPEFISYN